jgi:O-antigen/teichoic acid export membrane protein
VVLPAEQAWTITFTLALGELLGTRISDISAQAFQAFQRLSYSSAILTIHSGYRLVLAAFLLFGPVQKTAASWALLHMIGGFLAAFTGSMLVTKRLGRPRLGLGAMRRDWLEGFYYSTSASAEGAYNDLDKPLLLRLGGQTAAGAYSAAYRVMDAAFIPARALISASFPRFFQRGAYGIRESISLAGRLIPWVAGLGAVGGLGLVAFKSLVPFLLGDGYAEAGVIALWLAPIPLLRALHFMAANCLAGAGFQGLRTAVQLGVVLVNVGLCFLLIPRFGWLGAAWSSLISDGLLAGTLWICVGLKAHVAWAVVR